jgi:predicted acetyltransferase
MIFVPLDLSHKKHLNLNYKLYHDYHGSELNFVNLFAWKDVDSVEISVNDNYVVVKSVYDGNICFLPPIIFNIEQLLPCLDEIGLYCDQNEIPFIISGCTKTLVDTMEPLVQNHKIHLLTELSEYLHFPKDLITYSGKKFHAKRNHLNQFLKKYSYAFRPYQSDDYDSILSLVELWNSENGRPTLEKQAIINILNSLDQVDAFCDVLVIDYLIVAFSIGTISSNNTGIILFEKADTSYDGVYAALNNFVAESRYRNCIYINRQEDMGLEELKKSKLSYRPVAFEEKYSITKLNRFYFLKESLRNLYQLSFDDSHYYINFFFSEKYNLDQVVYESIDNEVISALYLIDKNLNFFGTIIPYPYIVAAATLPKYHKKGFMRNTIHRTLEKLYNQGALITGLNPFNNHFYKPFGFVFCSFCETHTISNNDTRLVTYTKGEQSTVSMLHHLYNLYTNKFDVFIERDANYWMNYLKEIIYDGGYIELLSIDNNNIGYLVYVNDKIEELCLLDFSSIDHLNKYAGHQVSLPSRSKTIPFNMIRIINVRSLLLQYPFEKSIHFDGTIKIDDRFFDKNNCTIRLTIIDGKVSIANSIHFEYLISIEELSSWIFGDHTLDTHSTLKSLFIPTNNLIFDKF